MTVIAKLELQQPGLRLEAGHWENAAPKSTLLKVPECFLANREPGEKGPGAFALQSIMALLFSEGNQE